MWNIFKWRDRMIKDELIHHILRRVFALCDIKVKINEDYHNKTMTEWSYYKEYWIIEGELIALRSLKKTLE